MNIGVKTDTGRIRENNQDAYYIPSEGQGPLYIIADGMGGHKAGEIASELAIDLISQDFNEYFHEESFTEEEIKEFIEASINKANKEIYNKSLEEESYSGMGTTVTLAYIYNDNLYIGHVGDSRAYAIQKGVIRQITEDHSLVEELIKNGSISKEEAKHHPQRNIITRAVGTSENIEIDIIVLPIKMVEIFLLCTDGLTSMLDDEEIQEVLTNSQDMQLACEKLVKLSNNRGGYDNITVLAIKF